MSARLLNGPRPLFVIVGAVVALAPGLGSGCGSSPTASSVPDASTHKEGGLTIETVVTEGGGAPSSSGAIVNPFGASSSGGPADSGSTPGDTGTAPDGSGLMSDGSGSSSGGSSSSSSSSGGSGPCDPYTPPMCGTTPCDLRSQTCCVTFTLQARCLDGANAGCNPNEVTVHCLQSCECGSGSVCCGVMNEIFGVVTSECQTVASLTSNDAGALECNPYPQTTTQASAQLCKTDAECENGSPCIAQTCVYGAMLSICGVQSQAPFNCAANP